MQSFGCDKIDDAAFGTVKLEAYFVRPYQDAYKFTLEQIFTGIPQKMQKIDIISVFDLTDVYMERLQTRNKTENEGAQNATLWHATRK